MSLLNRIGAVFRPMRVGTQGPDSLHRRSGESRGPLLFYNSDDALPAPLAQGRFVRELLPIALPMGTREICGVHHGRLLDALRPLPSLLPPVAVSRRRSDDRRLVALETRRDLP